MRAAIADFPWRWCLHWLVAPCLAPVIFWPEGGPTMARAIIACGCLGLVCAQLPKAWLKQVAAICLTLAMATVFVLMNFNLDTYSSNQFGFFLRESKWFDSPEYLMIATLVVVGLFVSVNYAPKVERFKGLRHWGLGIVAVYAMAGFDTFAANAALGSYGRHPDATHPFDSAVHDSGIGAASPSHHNLVVVLAESLGEPTFAAGKAQFAKDWDRPEWHGRYAVSHGQVEYFGATTYGEMRELCAKWGNYASLEIKAANCLPGKLERAGYQTTAIHAFDGDFFDRDQWWPKLGFDRELFSGDLTRIGVRSCGGVFPGACDADIPARIGSQLKQAGKPQFVYWLTLNSHLPVLPDASLGTETCEAGLAAIGSVSPRLCRLFMVHHNLADSISRMALDPELPPTDILIVGDHMPPYFDGNLREKFDQEHVPWILLRARDKGMSRSPAGHMAR